MAFNSSATNLVSGLGYFFYVNNVFVRDAAAGVTGLASINAAGTFAAAGAAQPALSADGRRVAFTSSDGNLIASDLNGRKDVFARDLLASQTYLASGVVTDDASSDTYSSLYDWPMISPDGTRVASVRSTTKPRSITSGPTNTRSISRTDNRTPGPTPPQESCSTLAGPARCTSLHDLFRKRSSEGHRASAGSGRSGRLTRSAARCPTIRSRDFGR